MKKYLTLLILFGFGLNLWAQNTDKLVDNYIKIKNSLVDSNFKNTAAAVLVFQKDLKAEKAFDKKAELTKSVDKLAKATSLEKQREAFYEFSTLMWDITKKSSKVSQPIYYQYCPMAKGYWLSKEQKVVNPYYGASMLNCGKVVETKK